jgi:Mg-chelatase subunit ChlD
MLRLGGAMAAALLCLAAANPAADAPERIAIRIDTPTPGPVGVDSAGMVFVSGVALAHSGEVPRFDVVFVLDVSGSTADASGADVNGDGEISRRGRGGLLGIGGGQNPDSILAAEVAAVGTLLDQLDSRTTRVGVVIFSGDQDPRTPDAFVEVELTRDYGRVRVALDDILLEGPHGGTNMHSGILRGTVELLGSKSAVSSRREGAQRIMMFLTDGVPTLPDLYSSHESAREAIRVARKAAKRGVRIHTFAIGREATRQPLAPLEVARATGAVFTPVEDPRDLQAAIENASFSDIEQLRIRNATTGDDARYRLRNPDGTFSGLVPLAQGRNVIEVFARSTSGLEETRTVAVELVGGAIKISMGERQRADLARLVEIRRQDLTVATSVVGEVEITPESSLGDRDPADAPEDVARP